MKKDEPPQAVCHRCLKDIFPKKQRDGSYVVEDFDGQPHKCMYAAPEEKDVWP